MQAGKNTVAFEIGAGDLDIRVGGADVLPPRCARGANGAAAD